MGWVYRFCQGLKGHRNAKEQLSQASQAIPLSIAEGNGKATDGDRHRYFEIARGSAMECGAIQDVLEVCGAQSAEENAGTKAVLDRIVAMLTKLGRRGYAVREEPAEYATGGGSIPKPMPIPTPRETRRQVNAEQDVPPDRCRAADRASRQRLVSAPA